MAWQLSLEKPAIPPSVEPGAEFLEIEQTSGSFMR
jgi:hypothetical protein